jgi:formate hydrogenlyase transcriptional activator
MSQTALLDVVSRYEALLRLSPALANHRSIDDLIGVLAERLHAIVPFDYLALVLHDAASDEMRLEVLEPAELPTPSVRSLPVSAGGPAAVVWQTQQPTVIPVPPSGTLVAALEYVRELGQTVTCWLPLTTVHGRLGVLSFGSSRATDYPPDAIAFMEQVASHVAVAVDNAINFDRSREFEAQLRAERDRLQLLLEINNLLVSHLDYPSLLTAISQSLQPVVAHDHVSVAVHDEDARGLQLPLAYDRDRGVSRPEVVWPMDRSPAGAAFQRRAASVFDRSAIDAFAPEGTKGLPTTERLTLCCLPLTTRHGTIGTLNVASAVAGFAPADVDLLAQIAVQIAIAVENAIAYRALADRHDHLLEEKVYLEDEIRLQHEFNAIVGRSPALKQVLQAANTVAPTDATVLLLGETGTGKELVARAIHDLSSRRQRTFVRLSGAALPAGLLESELFGYERGAFTGANATKLGRLEVADGGTLFLDEVGDIPLEVQPKLLRVLQEREFERLGSTRTRRVNVRIIAATNRDLEQMVADKSFRSDLYYRLNVFPIRLPPLRGRSEDIPALARYFTDRFARRMHRPVPAIPPHAMRALEGWHWPGNIRELENIIERAVILSPGPSLEVPAPDLQQQQQQQRQPAPDSMPTTLRDVERESIVRALRETRGVVGGPSGAAARLGLKRTTLQSMMQKLGIRRPTY